MGEVSLVPPVVRATPSDWGLGSVRPLCGRPSLSPRAKYHYPLTSIQHPVKVFSVQKIHLTHIQYRRPGPPQEVIRKTRITHTQYRHLGPLQKVDTKGPSHAYKPSSETSAGGDTEGPSDGYSASSSETSAGGQTNHSPQSEGIARTTGGYKTSPVDRPLVGRTREPTSRVRPPTRGGRYGGGIPCPPVVRATPSDWGLGSVRPRCGRPSLYVLLSLRRYQAAMREDLLASIFK